MKSILAKSAMPIASSDLEYRLSGGAANSNPAASLGGAMSSAAAPLNLFDDVSSAEALTGRVEYRGVYVRNSHPTLTLYDAKVWMASNTPSATTDIKIGIGTSAMNGQEQVVASETTKPTGVTFSTAASKAAGISLGDLPPGGGRFIWLERTVGAETAALASDPAVLRLEGDTNA